MLSKLNIAFLWHMHQPLYKDPFTGTYTMPWVLFHATKDYYDMASILDEFPDIHQTFNLVPCLIDQLNEYGSGHVQDRYRELSLKPATELDDDDKVFLIRNFFQANSEQMIRPLSRYKELQRKRGLVETKSEMSSTLRYFNDQDYLDLQVLLNLVWIDPETRRRDPFLTGLTDKGGGYTEPEKIQLLDKQIEIVNMILPKYRELSGNGIIEISTTPYYHPIMPLLCDSAVASEALPEITLPKERFANPEDARVQLMRGVELYTKTFGAAPRGLWPSEGSVSMGMLDLVREAGFEWLATDEQILAKSLGRHVGRDEHGNCRDAFIYRPYAIETNGKSLSMVFRDHLISDLIGFDYARVDPADAASDMISRLEKIHSMVDDPESHVVNIILDGENAWECYRNDGRDFLVALYTELSKNPKLKCVTVSEFLDKTRERGTLERVWPGSWINHNYKIWIGHSEDNVAWDYISEARKTLVEYEKSCRENGGSDELGEAIAEAWEELYAAEGSDWFWWYGDDHSTASDDLFDSLFRLHIKKIYSLIKMDYPVSLDIPISSGKKALRPDVLPTASINPLIDGEVSNYYEWLTAGRFELFHYGGSMHSEEEATGLVSGISYGFNDKNLFFRLDYNEEVTPFDDQWSFTLNFHAPRPVRVEASIKGGKGGSASALLFEKPSESWVECGPLDEIASDSVVELALPLETLGAGAGSEIKLFLTIDARERSLARWPASGYLLLEVPSEDQEEHDWIV